MLPSFFQNLLDPFQLLSGEIQVIPDSGEFDDLLRTACADQGGGDAFQPQNPGCLLYTSDAADEL